MHTQLSWLIPVLGGCYLFAVYLVLLILQNTNLNLIIATVWDILTGFNR